MYFRGSSFDHHQRYDQLNHETALTAQQAKPKEARQRHSGRVKLQTMLHYPAKLLRTSLAVILSLWIAGAGCMLGCQNMVAYAAGSVTAGTEPAGHHTAVVVGGETCASNQSHDCCAKKQSEKKVEARKASALKSTARPSLQTAMLMSLTASINPQHSDGRGECPLALSRAVAVTKPSGGNQTPAPVVLPLRALPVETSVEQQPALFPLARLPNRGHTYLRCCVFLI